MTSPPTPLPRKDVRERRRLATLETISDAAYDLFASQGFEGTTIEDIATAAGISARTYFRYFRTKEEAVLTSYFEFSDTILAWLEQDHLGDVVPSLEEAVQKAMALIDSDPRARERLLRSRRLIADEPALQAAEADADAQAARAFAQLLQHRTTHPLPPVEAQLVSRITVGVALVAMEHWSMLVREGTQRASLAEVYEQMRGKARILFRAAPEPADLTPEAGSLASGGRHRQDGSALTSPDGSVLSLNGSGGQQ